MTVASVDLLETIYLKKYHPKELFRYFAEKSELVSWIPLKTDFGEWRWWRTFQTSTVRGSTAFGTALANKNVPSFARPEIHRSQDHVVVSVSCEAARAAKKGDCAIIDELDSAVESSMSELALSTENLLVGNGGGARARLAASGGASGSTLTLLDPDKAYLFSPGMKLQASDDDGSAAAHALLDSGGTAEILSVNQAAGTLLLTTTIAASGIPSVGNNDYLFREGDFDDGVQRVLQGFFAWNPHTAPTAGDSFFTIDRSNNVGALSGMRINGAGANGFSTVKEAASLIKRNRGKADTLWVGPGMYAALDDYIASKQTFTQEFTPGIGVGGFEIHTVVGKVKVMASSAFPDDVGLLTKRDSWLMRSLDGFPHPVDDDGRIWHLESTSDALQARHRYYAQLGCIRPNDSCAITF